MARILRWGTERYVNAYRDGQASGQVRSVLAKLSLCRTRCLGGHRFRCDDCGSQTHVYNSCGDRHCPQCSGGKRYEFSQRAEALLLEGIVYYQVVFTLPSELSRLALAHLNRLRDRGELKLEGNLSPLQDDLAWQAWLHRLRSVAWVSYIEPPPSASSHPHQVVRYLTRYLTGGPISDARIIAADSRSVTFWAREGTKAGGARRQVPVTIPTEEFVRRWCLHIQPSGLTKTRYFGGWSNARRVSYLEECVRHMEAADVPIADDAWDFPPTTPSSAGDTDTDAKDTPHLCAHCGGQRLRLVETTGKPSWRTVLSPQSDSCPRWYADSWEADARRFWDEAKGSGFYDWYLEHREQSAYASESISVRPAPDPPPVQLELPLRFHHRPDLSPPPRNPVPFHIRSF